MGHPYEGKLYEQRDVKSYKVGLLILHCDFFFFCLFVCLLLLVINAAIIINLACTVMVGMFDVSFSVINLLIVQMLDDSFM